MKKIPQLVIYLFFTLLANAQPTFQWAKKFGGNMDDYGNSITTDASGNVYTTGYFALTVDFDPGPGTYTLNATGNSIFISKLDASGNFVWAKTFSSSGSSQGNAIAVDATGNVYTAGFFSGNVDFDPGIGTSTMASAGSSDIFVSKLDAGGNFVWAKTIGSTSIDAANALMLDGTGNVYVAGYFIGSVDFDPGPATSSLISISSSADIFVWKLDALGNLVWAKAMGGTDIDVANSIGRDNSGNIYTTGYCNGAVDFDPGPGSYSLTSTYGSIFVSKLDGSGNFVWAKEMWGPSGANANRGNAIAVDGAGNAYTTGYYDGQVDFDPGPGTFTMAPPSNTDIFLSKLDASGNFVWAKKLGGSAGDGGRSIALDAAGNIYTTGYFDFQGDFDPGPAVATLTSGGSIDIFISKLDPSGNYVWAINIGAGSNEYGNCLSVDASGNIYTTGYFNGNTDMDPGPGSYTFTTVFSSNDAYVLKLSANPVGVIENRSNTELLIYPNPNSGSFKIEMDNEIQNGEIILINSIGQKVFEQKIIEGTNNINTTNLSTGLYNCILLQGRQQMNCGKLVIE